MESKDLNNKEDNFSLILEKKEFDKYLINPKSNDINIGN